METAPYIIGFCFFLLGSFVMIHATRLMIKADDALRKSRDINLTATSRLVECGRLREQWEQLAACANNVLEKAREQQRAGGRVCAGENVPNECIEAWEKACDQTEKAIAAYDAVMNGKEKP